MEVIKAIDGTVNVALGGQIHDNIKLNSIENLVNSWTITYVGLNKPIAV